MIANTVTTTYPLGHYERKPTHVVDTLETPPDLFLDAGATDWKHLTWRDVGRPHRVERWAEDKRRWEAENGRALPVQVGWEYFNRSFHELFLTAPDEESGRAWKEAVDHLGRADVGGAWDCLTELLQLRVWNQVHRKEDAVWDPRGKRALFGGLPLKRPKILYLGAADGYEGMQLCALYPGAELVLVDYDDFCRTDRFGKFPEAYPFVGADPTTGGSRVWHREEMNIHFEVSDIRDLKFGREFDLVVSVGLVEHFPDDLKGEAFEWHRKFLKPGGTAIITTPRDQWRGRAFYTVMADMMNFGYRELMKVEQLGLYAYENGFDIRRAGVIKAHNGLICRVR